MAEFTFELERSSYFKKRSELLKSSGTPKLSDAKANLGDTMANVLFDQCEVALRDEFGLKVPLKGPGDVLWVSPSDQLIGKIALKPPFTPKCLQALTHKGILEIGQELEKKFREEMELDKQKALDKFRADLLSTVEERMKLEIKDVEIRERFACQTKMERQQQEFEVFLKEELDALELRIRLQYEQITSNRDLLLKANWEEKLQKEIDRTVDMLSRKYLLQLNDQENRLTETFRLEIKKQEILRDFDAKLHKRKNAETLHQLKRNLECTNLVNMMYVLCTERRKCCVQKEEIEEYYKNEINRLEQQIKQKDEHLAKVYKEKKKQISEVSVRETCLREVIKHFQKFINFALRAAPTQAEFLLSVEKMMIFELTNEIVTSEIQKGREMPAIIPWNQEKKIQPLPEEAPPTLNIKDFHDCLHELNPPIKGPILGENDNLPAMYFKNKTYVREDFRDMLSSGVKFTPSCELWNEDVEILIDHLGTGESSESKPSADFCPELRGSVDQNNMGSTLQNECEKSNKSTVQFVNKAFECHNTKRESTESKKVCRKSSLKPNSFPIVENISFEQFKDLRSSASMILAARDSLDILMEKMRTSSPAFETPVQAKEEFTVIKLPDKPDVKAGDSIELVSGTRDSILMRLSEQAKTRSSAEFVASPKDSIELMKRSIEKEYELGQKSSRLTEARNSVEILRESLQKLKVPSFICQKKVIKKHEDKVVLPTSFAGSCCERCKRAEGESAIGDPIRNSVLTKIDSGDVDERSVKISRIQIINLDDNLPSPSVVNFGKSKAERQANYYKGISSSTKRKQNLRKKAPSVRQLNVSGNRQEESQFSDEFTVERIHSMIKLMRDQPHLLELFTAVSR